MSETLVPWSFSRLLDFEQCKFRFKLKYLDKVPEPKRALKEGEVELPNERGDRVHKAGEAWVRSTTPAELPTEFSAFAPEMAKVKEYFVEGKVRMEENWGYDFGWGATDFFGPDIWLRVKVDLFVHHSDTTALVADYKTGRKSGNEVKHGEQGALYALCAFMRYPELEDIHTEFWYLDKDDITHQRYTREGSLKKLANWNKRAIAISEEKTWRPNPNQHTCRFCLYGPKGSGVCKVGV